VSESSIAPRRSLGPDRDWRRFGTAHRAADVWAAPAAMHPVTVRVAGALRRVRNPWAGCVPAADRRLSMRGAARLGCAVPPGIEAWTSVASGTRAARSRFWRTRLPDCSTGREYSPAARERQGALYQESIRWYAHTLSMRDVPDYPAFLRLGDTVGEVLVESGHPLRAARAGPVPAAGHGPRRSDAVRRSVSAGDSWPGLLPAARGRLGWSWSRARSGGCGVRSRGAHDIRVPPPTLPRPSALPSAA